MRDDKSEKAAPVKQNQSESDAGGAVPQKQGESKTDRSKDKQP